MLEGPGNAKALDTLRAPLGADRGARNAPDLFGIGLEKCVVELFAEAIDEELLQSVFLFFGKGCALHVADADLEGAPRAEVHQRAFAERDGIVEKAAQIVNARFAVAQQHDAL